MIKILLQPNAKVVNVHEILNSYLPRFVSSVDSRNFKLRAILFYEKSNALPTCIPTHNQYKNVVQATSRLSLCVEIYSSLQFGKATSEREVFLGIVFC